jgi:hypothetical protein
MKELEAQHDRDDDELDRLEAWQYRARRFFAVWMNWAADLGLDPPAAPPELGLGGRQAVPPLGKSGRHRSPDPPGDPPETPARELV